MVIDGMKMYIGSGGAVSWSSHEIFLTGLQIIMRLI